MHKLTTFDLQHQRNGIMQSSLAASGVLLGSEDTWKDSFSGTDFTFRCCWWGLSVGGNRFHGEVCFQAISNGTALSFRNIRPPRPFDMLLSLKCIAKTLCDASEIRKNIPMCPSFFHFLSFWKLKESDLFSFWSNTPSLCAQWWYAKVNVWLLCHVSCDAS